MSFSPINLELQSSQLVRRLRDESTEEAQRAGSLAKSLGVDHVITHLEWGRVVSRTAHRARCMRYSVLMRECQRLKMDMLMVGHHRNDQIGM